MLVCIETCGVSVTDGIGWLGYFPLFSARFCRMDIRWSVRDIVRRKVVVDDDSGIVISFEEKMEK